MSIVKEVYMITAIKEYQNIIHHQLEENWTSFNILFELKHYGNCISIMCQELDQYIRILYLLKQTKGIKDKLIECTLNNQKWFTVGIDNKKVYITEEQILEFTETLSGWEKGICTFGIIFRSLSNNNNYILKNPIKSLDENERLLLLEYIREYHQNDFPDNFDIENLIPILPMIFSKISESIKEYSNKI
jgi:hypothetical protein